MTLAYRIPVSIALLGSILLLAGCVSESEMLREQGYPAAYADGFEDGCHSGNQAAGSLFDQFAKDVNRFNSDNDYEQGWSDGFRQCETQQESIQRQVRISEQSREWDEDRWDRIEHEAMRDIDTRGLNTLDD